MSSLLEVQQAFTAVDGEGAAEDEDDALSLLSSGSGLTPKSGAPAPPGTDGRPPLAKSTLPEADRNETGGGAAKRAKAE